jgi:hypothetical protein
VFRLSLWFLPRAFLIRTGAAGISRYPAFPAPSIFGGSEVLGKARATTAARTPAHAALARRRIGCLTFKSEHAIRLRLQLCRAGSGLDAEQKACKNSTTRSARGRHPCLGYDLLPMSPGWTNSVVAEREGFEPPIGLHLCRISSAVHSTTLPPLLGAKSGSCPTVGAVF